MVLDREPDMKLDVTRTAKLDEKLDGKPDMKRVMEPVGAG